MNILPEILRQSNSPVVYRRQGPEFFLKMGGTFSRASALSTERNSDHANRTLLKVNRYSIDKNEMEKRRTVNYPTISYDFRNDPEFLGTRGKKNQIQSYQNLINERQQEANIVLIKIAAFRGTKQQYLSSLKSIQKSFNSDLVSFENSFMEATIKLKQLLSDLRRETQAQIRSFKQDLKQQNDELIIYCEELKRIDAHYKRVKEILQPI